jgi:peptidase E
VSVTDGYRYRMKLLLSSFGPSPSHDAALVAMAGKPLDEIRVGYIENAYDVYHDQASLDDGRESLRRDGYTFELVDLREWRSDREGLRGLLGRFDAFLLTGGNPFYLRSLMKLTSADAVITERSGTERSTPVPAPPPWSPDRRCGTSMSRMTPQRRRS